MKRDRHIGLEQRDGYDVGRDPRNMSAAELEGLGHARVSPLRALRMKCFDCCNGSTQEVRLCTAVDCPSWPFRMGRNLWRVPLSAAVRTQRAATMARNREAALTTPNKTQAQTGNSVSDGGRVPSGEVADFAPIENSADAGGAE
jgi:hypothetical protein